MRYYKLKIGNITYEANKNNRTPLNIEFDIKAYSQGMASIPGFITIYNNSIDNFTKSRELIGEDIELRAGIENNLYTQRLGYTNVKDDLLMKGKIANILGDYSNITPRMYFYFSIIEFKKKVNSNKEEQFRECIIKIPQNTIIIDSLIKGIKFFTNWNVKSSVLAKTISNNSKTDIIITATSIENLITQFKEMFSIDINIDTLTQTIELYKINEKELPKGLIVIQPNDLLQQPEILSIALDISCVTRLRGDLRLNSLIMLYGTIPSSSSFSQSLLTLTKQGKAMNVLRLGVYRIIDLQHKGSFYNISPEGWCTSFRAIPYTQTNSTSKIFS